MFLFELKGHAELACEMVDHEDDLFYLHHITYAWFGTNYEFLVHATIRKDEVLKIYDMDEDSRTLIYDHGKFVVNAAESETHFAGNETGIEK